MVPSFATQGRRAFSATSTGSPEGHRGDGKRHRPHPRSHRKDHLAGRGVLDISASRALAVKMVRRSPGPGLEGAVRFGDPWRAKRTPAPPGRMDGSWTSTIPSSRDRGASARAGAPPSTLISINEDVPVPNTMAPDSVQAAAPAGVKSAGPVHGDRRPAVDAHPPQLPARLEADLGAVGRPEGRARAFAARHLAGRELIHPSQPHLAAGEDRDLPRIGRNLRELRRARSVWGEDGESPLGGRDRARTCHAMALVSAGRDGEAQPGKGDPPGLPRGVRRGRAASLHRRGEAEDESRLADIAQPLTGIANQAAPQELHHRARRLRGQLRPRDLLSSGPRRGYRSRFRP